MLGRRAVMAAVVAGATAFSGGVALASSHGTSHPSKPAGVVQNVAQHKAVPKQHVHHCPNMGGSSGASYSSSMDSSAL